MKVLAIDPGYERLGVAVLEKKPGDRKETLLFSDCIQTPKTSPHSERLGSAAKQLQEVIEAHKPQFLSIETLFFNSNTTTAMKVAEARGAIIAAAVNAGLRVCEYSPQQIKVAVTGYGKSDKESVIKMVPKLIAISKKIKYDDEYDAIAAGLTFFACERFPLP